MQGKIAKGKNLIKFSFILIKKLSPLEKVIYTKTCYCLSISYKDEKHDSGLFQVDSEFQFGSENRNFIK